jgi:diguanylate cyclase (GGDEF)-like protein
MLGSWRNRVRQLAGRLRGWQLVQLPRWLVAFVAVVIGADAVAVGRAALHVPAIRPADLLVFGLLVGCSAVTVERTRRLGESALLTKEVFGVWELPIAILLPPVFALLAPFPRLALLQWRVRKVAPHRRVFTAAAISLSYGAAHLAFSELSRLPLVSPVTASRWSVLAVLAVAVCFGVQWAVNNLFVFIAVKGSEPGVSARQMMFGKQSLHHDLTEVCVATVVTLGIVLSPFAILFAMPFVTLLQRSSRHAQLVDASRIDAKTGLLNAVIWRRESASEVARAERSGSPLAVALIDIDHFKDVNDTFGHLAGDEALSAISQTLQLAVRQDDLVGRFGGEEFSLLLPQADAADARMIAERIRAGVEGLRIDSGVPGAPIKVTVSVGVVALGGGVRGQITELLAAADAALYRAKRAGRNRVWVTTATESTPAAPLTTADWPGQPPAPATTASLATDRAAAAESLATESLQDDGERSRIRE